MRPNPHFFRCAGGAKRLVAAVFTVSFCVAGTAHAQRPQALSAPQQETFERVAAQEFCGCLSPLTLKDCLQKKPGCAMSRILGQVLSRAIAMGAPQSALETLMSQDVLGPFCSPTKPFEVAGAPQQGSAASPVTVVEFADFRCAHCKQAVPVVHDALHSYGKKVRLVYAPIAISDAPESMAAAEAAMAAHAQGKFWEMHATLFAHQDSDFSRKTLVGLARTLKLDVKRFEKDLESHRFAADVRRFKQQATDLGVSGTPAFFVSGRPYKFSEVLPLEERLEMELERAEKDCQ